MSERIIIRGDSYGLRRPLYTIELLNVNGEPFDLAGCTIRTTYKPSPIQFSDDPEDVQAPIRHELKVDTAGVATVQSGLYMVGPATDGVIQERLTSQESLGLPLETVLYSDIELEDANGEIFTWITTETLKAVDAYTNRSH